MSSQASQPATPEWLTEKLTELLKSPYIHFTQPKIPGLQLRMGPGPIDLFSTRFANMCTDDVTGVLAGAAVDKDGLKQGLLALQKKINAGQVQTGEAQGAEGYQTATKMLFAAKEGDDQVEVSAAASVREQGGLQRISALRLDGDSSLFQSPTTSA
ncbi:hypothetical protein PsYK624_056640 [Phanerochaete sordida]|uniref:Uncharacterized protein n=1 Tax=Phanerochaete sordida TaxID=48140 RepID=A0A9P3LBK1_9APHY|nr:hypothetical protein PsYK624_056640 [Phanerochaete sordida]